MNRHYAMRLLREVAESLGFLVTRRKFWDMAFFGFYLERCDEVLFNDPERGLQLTSFAPELAEKVAENHPEASHPVLLLQAYGYLGSAYRRSEKYGRAEETFREGLRFERFAPGKILADFYRRLAYLRIFQGRPEAFELIGDAITIHKRGNLVDRHALGECLLCRAHAYFQFKQPGKSLEDLTAALNHISIQKDEKPYFAALHNLAIWAVDYGTEGELEQAMANLKPALAILNTCPRRHYAKYRLRWLIAVVDMRLGLHGKAEMALLEVRKGLVRLKLAAELGLLTVDLAQLYLDKGYLHRLHDLVEETDRIYAELRATPELRVMLGKIRTLVASEDLQELRAFFQVLATPPAPQIAA